MISAKRGAAPVEPVGAGNGAGAPASNQPAPDGRWAGLVAAGRLDPAALRSAACPICATERAHLRATGCCITAICAGCIGTTVRAKAEAASQLVVEYLDKAHQCPQCGHGPVEHFACGDLTAHDVGHNKCERCSFRADNIGAWSPWNGELPLELRPVDGCFDCPFCRKTARLDEVLLSPAERAALPFAGELWKAAAAGDAAAVGRLLAMGVDQNEEGEYEGEGAAGTVTPLYMTAARGHVGCVQRLVAAGADADQPKSSNGATPLLIAAQKGHEAVARLLLEHNAAVDKADEDGDTPLSIASWNGHDAVARLLRRGMLKAAGR